MKKQKKKKKNSFAVIRVGVHDAFINGSVKLKAINSEDLGCIGDKDKKKICEKAVIFREVELLLA